MTSDSSGDEPASQMRTKVGLIAGASGAAVALLLWPIMLQIPFGFLLLDAAMAWGVLSALRARNARDGNARPTLVAALAPFLVAGLIMRQVLDPQQWGLGVTHTLLLPASAVTMALFVDDGGARTKWIGLMGGGLLLVLVLAALFRAPAYGAMLFVIALLLVALLLFGQAIFAQRLRGKMASWASAAALTVAASQLLDGAVTYLAVRDPLDVTPRTFYEQMPASDWILEHLGPGYILVKWALALAIVLGIESKGAWKHDAAGRVGLYLLISMLGFGPGLFSAGNLLR